MGRISLAKQREKQTCKISSFELKSIDISRQKGFFIQKNCDLEVLLSVNIALFAQESISSEGEIVDSWFKFVLT